MIVNQIFFACSVHFLFIQANLSIAGCDKKAVVDYLIKNGIVDTFCLILKSRERFSASTFALVAEILAEVSKLGIIICFIII